jgi:hypothetical protein
LPKLPFEKAKNDGMAGIAGKSSHYRKDTSLTPKVSASLTYPNYLFNYKVIEDISHI